MAKNYSVVTNFIAKTSDYINNIREATNKTSEFASSAKKKVDNISSGMKNAGGTLFKYVTAPLMALGGIAFASANDIDKAMANIRAGTGATGRELESLGDDFKEVFKGVPQSADEVSRAIADLNTRTGLSGEPLQNLTKQMLDFSRIAGVETSQLIANTTRVFEDWDIATENQAETLDYLWKVSQNTGIGVDNLSQKVVQFGAPLRQMGFDFETTAALLGSFEQQGVNTELVMGSMRQGLSHFAREGIDAKEGLLETIEAIKMAGSESEATAIAMEVFGARAGADMASAVREGRFEIDELLNTLSESGETITQAGEDTLTFGDKVANLKNQTQVGLEPLGSILIEMAEEWLPPIINLVNRLAEWFNNLSPSMQKTAVIGGLVVGFLGPLLLGLGMVIPVIWGAVTATWAFTSALLANPITWIVLLLVGLISTIYLLWTNWDTVSEWLADSWEWIKDKATEIWNGIKDFFSDLWEGIKDMFKNTWEWIKQLFLDYHPIGLVITHWETIKQFFIDLWQKVKDYFLSAWEWIKKMFFDYTPHGLIIKHWDTIKKFFTDLWDKVKDYFKRAWEWIKKMFLNYTPHGLVIKHWDTIKKFFLDLWERVKSTFRNAVSAIKNSLLEAYNWVRGKLNDLLNFVSGLKTKFTNKAKGMWDGIKDAFKGAINWIIRKWNDFQIRLGGQKVNLPFGQSFEIPSITLRTPNIPFLADGGLVTAATLAMVGEGGESEAVLPLSKLFSMMDNFADNVFNRLTNSVGDILNEFDDVDNNSGQTINYSPNFNVTVNGDVKDPKNTGKQIAAEASKYLFEKMNRGLSKKGYKAIL